MTDSSRIPPPMRPLLRLPYRMALGLMGIQPASLRQNILGLLPFLRDWLAYRQQSSTDEVFPATLANIYPCFGDRHETAATLGEYFHQDLWVAQKVFAANPLDHWDIGSRVDGFIAHLLTFRSVNVIDIRPLQTVIPGLVFHQGSLTTLPLANNSVVSLSCLHTVEHIGLGRYGDRVDPTGWRQAMQELQRILQPGGTLYFSVPIGQQRVEFNAHRVFSPTTILQTFSNLSLVEFVAVNHQGILPSTQPQDFQDIPYACGIFVFTKPSL
jgi:SAM-dependent methyltransferase